MRPDLSIVIPVFNSSRVLSATVAEVEQVAGELCEALEIVLVDDGSSDDSGALCRELASASRHVVAVCLARNFGQHNAILAGLHQARGVRIAVMDDDGQHDPRDLEPMLAALAEGHDAVFADYAVIEQPLYKKLGSRLTNRVAGWLIDKPPGLYLSTYKMISAGLKDELLRYDGPHPYLDGLILTTTRRVASVKGSHRPSAKGATSYTPGKLLAHWLDMVANFSFKPLRMVFFCALFCGLLSLVVIGVTLVERLFFPGYAPPGWTTNFLLILLFGTIQFLTLGLLGEYVGRILLVLNRRPQFIVREVVRGQEAASRSPTSQDGG